MDMDIFQKKSCELENYNYSCDTAATELPPGSQYKAFDFDSKDQNDNQKRKSSASDSPARSSPKRTANDEEYSGSSFSSFDHNSTSQKSQIKVTDDMLCRLCFSPPIKPPLMGCVKGHFICAECRDKGGVLLSCPPCRKPEIYFRLREIEQKLFTKDCSYATVGCKLKISEEAREEHELDCAYRIVHCPKKLFAKSCSYSTSFINIREHARIEHGYDQGFTKLDRGFITSKMMDRKTHGQPSLVNIYNESARFPPIEIEYDQTQFYSYYERKHSRSIWIFFIRVYGSPQVASKFKCEMYIGPGDLDKNDQCDAERVYRGNVVPYKLTREEIHNSGSCLVIDDATMRSFQREDILFRMWWRVMKRTASH